jgi:hypothetical protein
MPAAVWQPLLKKNFGLPPEEDGVVLDSLPDLLFAHGVPLLPHCPFSDLYQLLFC